MICTLAALCAVQQLSQLRRYVDAGLNIGLPPEAPFMIFAQIGIYASFAATEAATEVADAVYRGRGIALPTPAAELPLDALDQRGRELMAKLHGDRGTQGYAAPENPFTSRLYPMTIAYGYGEIWHRPGLELRQRAMVSLAGFTALQLQDQLRKFAQSARNIGLTLDEVCETIIQTSPYSGYAPALNALRWLSECCERGHNPNMVSLRSRERLPVAPLDRAAELPDRGVAPTTLRWALSSCENDIGVIHNFCGHPCGATYALPHATPSFMRRPKFEHDCRAAANSRRRDVPSIVSTVTARLLCPRAR